VKNTGLTDGTIYKYKAWIENRSFRGKTQDDSLAAARVRIPQHVYMLAKNLRKAIRVYVVGRGGDVDDLAMTATASRGHC
jgi:hypothetical protein